MEPQSYKEPLKNPFFRSECFLVEPGSLRKEVAQWLSEKREEARRDINTHTHARKHAHKQTSKWPEWIEVKVQMTWCGRVWWAFHLCVYERR